MHNRGEEDMSDGEFLDYIHSIDSSRHQSTSNAHDRYSNAIMKEKEDVLLSSLNIAGSSSSGDITDHLRFEPNYYDHLDVGCGPDDPRAIIKPNNKNSLSLPPSPESECKKQFSAMGQCSNRRRKSDVGLATTATSSRDSYYWQQLPIPTSSKSRRKSDEPVVRRESYSVMHEFRLQVDCADEIRKDS